MNGAKLHFFDVGVLLTEKMLAGSPTEVKIHFWFSSVFVKQKKVRESPELFPSRASESHVSWRPRKTTSRLELLEMGRAASFLRQVFAAERILQVGAALVAARRRKDARTVANAQTRCALARAHKPHIYETQERKRVESYFKFSFLSARRPGKTNRPEAQRMGIY